MRCAESRSVPISCFVSTAARRKRALGRELRDLTFRLSVVAGIFAGLLWYLHHPHSSRTHSQATGCAAHHGHRLAASQLGHCVGSALSRELVSWLIPIGVGLLLGTVIGIALAQIIRLGRGSDHTRMRRTP